jgi:uncharacterized HAD superfamily protein
MNFDPIKPEEIGFDIDGVVADTAGAFLRIAARDFGIDWLTVDDISEYDVENCVDIAPGIIREIFARLMDDPLEEGLQPMPHAVAVLEKLARKAPLTFITARPGRDPILEWLQETLSTRAFGATRLTATGLHDGKGAYIKEQGLHFFIDDRAETCIALEKQGLTPIVYHQPWNAGRHTLASVDGWLAIEKLCLL